MKHYTYLLLVAGAAMFAASCLFSLGGWCMTQQNDIFVFAGYVVWLMDLVMVGGVVQHIFHEAVKYSKEVGNEK